MVKSRALYVILGIFLGGFGIHNFYIGYSGRAITQLLITLLTAWLIVPIIFLGLWILLEIICVSKDSKGVPLG